jgi:hypothetical protein
MPDVLRIQAGETSIEDVVAGWYSFQNIDSIHRAFSDWFQMDIWKVLRRRRRIGKSLPILENRLNQLIEFRHGIVHRFTVDVELRKQQIQDTLDVSMAVIDAFVDNLEHVRGIPIRD